MQTIKRNQCVITGEKDLEFLYTFRNFPVFMGCTDQPEYLDLKHDMNWLIGKVSGAIQLETLLPLEVLYPESHGAGAVGPLWAQHHKSFAKFINKINPSFIFEIGGAHGILESEYQNYGLTDWTILEPNPSPVPSCNARFIKGFFNENFIFNNNFDAVVHSHVFEHMYNLIDFVKILSSFISDGKFLIFSIPNMESMLKRKYTNCINFEHTVFLTEDYVEFLLNQHCFQLLNKEYFMDDHSIFYLFVKDRNVKPSMLPLGLYEKNKSLYIDYINYHKSLIKDLNYNLNLSNEPIYLFGAHVFSQYLIQMGLETKNILCILDNDLNKQGLRLYGTKLIVSSPKVLSEKRSPKIILKAGVYNQEIKKDILNNINNKAIFIE